MGRKRRALSEPYIDEIQEMSTPPAPTPRTPSPEPVGMVEEEGGELDAGGAGGAGGEVGGD